MMVGVLYVPVAGPLRLRLYILCVLILPLTVCIDNAYLVFTC